MTDQEGEMGTEARAGTARGMLVQLANVREQQAVEQAVERAERDKLARVAQAERMFGEVWRTMLDEDGNPYELPPVEVAAYTDRGSVVLHIDHSFYVGWSPESAYALRTALACDSCDEFAIGHFLANAYALGRVLREEGSFTCWACRQAARPVDLDAPVVEPTVEEQLVDALRSFVMYHCAQREV